MDLQNEMGWVLFFKVVLMSESKKWHTLKSYREFNSEKVYEGAERSNESKAKGLWREVEENWLWKSNDKQDPKTVGSHTQGKASFLYFCDHYS